MSIMEQLTKVVVAQMRQPAAAKTGLSESVAESLMPMAMAAILGGLKKNVAKPNGAEALANALNRHDGSLLNNAERVAEDDVLSDGGKILKHVFGGKLGATQDQLAKAAGGVSQDQIAKILAMAAPAVLASLGRAKREQGLDTSALAGLVTEESVRVEREAPRELSGLMAMLDADGDGDVKEEAIGLGRKLLGGLFSRRR